jgi:hypothetical protein
MLGLLLRVLEGDRGDEQCGDEAQLLEEEPGAIDCGQTAGAAWRCRRPTEARAR